MRIYSVYHGSEIWSPIYNILEFGIDDIWFGPEIHWDGIEFKTKPMNISFPYRVNNLWGKIPNNFYIVGNDGAIAHNDGQNWQKIESGTELNINDIYGAENPETGELEIYYVASNHLSDPQYRREILKINSDHSVTKLNTEPINWTLYSLWFSPGKKYFVAGSGIYEKDTFSDSLWQSKAEEVVQYYTYRIRGNSENDVVAVGGYGEILHFNGSSWKSYLPEMGLKPGNYYSVDIYKDLIVAVGSANVSAEIAVGIRNKL